MNDVIDFKLIPILTLYVWIYPVFIKAVVWVTFNCLGLGLSNLNILHHRLSDYLT